MAVRREIFEEIGGFRDGFGKIDRRSNPEDTDLCLRATEASAGGVWIYDPAGVVSHRIPHEYTTLRFILARCFSQGKGKASLATMNGMIRSTSTERWYVRRVLPRGIARGLREVARGDFFGACRSLVIVAALFMALVGFASNRAATTRNFAVSRVNGVRVTGRRKGAPAAQLPGPSAGSPEVPKRVSVFSARGENVAPRSPVALADAAKTRSAKVNQSGHPGP
jgi:hypothetical protein